MAELDALRTGPAEARTADGHLLYAQALDATGQGDAALTEYQALAEYFPGEEARCRYAELLERTGATELGRAQYREVIRRVDLQGGVYRRAQKSWYDIARRAVA